jgi:PKD repeat protein
MSFSVGTGAGPISLSLVPGRTSGVAPLAVFFDATGTTATTTTKPFHHIEYRWDFGDPAGSPVSGTTWSTGSRPGVSSRNTATGAVAAHVFETPGTYTVTLTAFDGTNTDTRTVTITVDNPDDVFAAANTFCVGATSLPTAGSGGCPGGALVRQTSSFATVRTFIAQGRRVLLRRGDTFDASTNGFNNVNGPWILGAFGSGAKPIIRATANGIDLFRYGNSGGPYTDMRLMDLTFEANGFANVNGATYLGGGPNARAPQYYDQLLLLRVDVRNVDRGFLFMQQRGIFVVDATIRSIANAVYGGAQQSATLGGSFTQLVAIDAGNGLYRSGDPSKLVIANNDLIGAQYFRQHMKLHSAAEFGVTSRYFIISDNRFAASSIPTAPGSAGDVWWLEIGPANASETELMEDFIVERNWFTGNGVVSRYVYMNESKGTIRNNLFDFTRGDPNNQNWAVSIFQFGAGVPAPDDIQVYNNTAYSSATNTNSQGFAMVMVDEAGRGATNIVIRNNYASMPNYINKVMVIDPFSRATVSNNTLTNTPGWVSATPSVPADFKPAAGSAAIGTGTVVPVWSDFFGVSEPAPRDKGAVNH